MEERERNHEPIHGGMNMGKKTKWSPQLSIPSDHQVCDWDHRVCELRNTHSQVSQVVHVMGEWDLNKSITCLLSVRSTPCSDLTHHKYQVLIRVVFTHFAWFSMASSWRCSLFSFHLTKSCLHVQMSVGTLHDAGLYLNGLAFKKLYDYKTSNFRNMKLCWLSQ